MQELNSNTENSERNCNRCAEYIALKQENHLLKEQLCEMKQHAHHDVLTGLPNRRHFVENLEQRIMRCQRYGDNTALLFLDVDDLKTVNDTHSHGAGDALLVRLAVLLQGNIRVSDMAARIGGDEFAVLLDNLDADQVDDKIKMLIDRISNANFHHDGKEHKLSAAIGYCFVGPKDNISQLAAMYEAKSAAG